MPKPPQGRIVFPGNPWPAGHPVHEFAWSGELSPDLGLRLHLHLRSEDYDAEGPGAEPAEDDACSWAAPIVWNNYHACILSSTHWGHAGISLADTSRPLGLDTLLGGEIACDPLPIDISAETAFGIYLLGHDTVADHHFAIHPDGPQRFRLRWRGRIALTYSGDDEFAHEFSAELRGVPPLVIGCADATSEAQARSALEACVREPWAWHIERLDGAWRARMVDVA